MAQGKKAKFRLVYPFHVDHGELDGLTPAQIFTLGVEWQMFRENSEKGAAFTATIHKENADRLAAILIHLGRNWTSRSLGNEWVAMDVKRAA